MGEYDPGQLREYMKIYHTLRKAMEGDIGRGDISIIGRVYSNRYLLLLLDSSRTLPMELRDEHFTEDLGRLEQALRIVQVR